jgi:hypothetical protein
MHSDTNDGFIRTPVGGNPPVLIKSTCKYCGAVIVANTSADLVDEEDQHILQCSIPTL